MDLELTDDQHDLRSAARRFLDEQSPLAVAREFLEGRHEARALQRSVADLGWYGVGLDEDPFGVPGLCLLAHEVGAHAAPVPIVEGAVAARLARAALDEGADDPLVEDAAEGSALTALAILERGGSWELGNLRSHADDTAKDSYVLHATKIGVPHGAAAEVLAFVAMIDETPGALFVPADAYGCSVVPAPGLDPSSALSRAIADGVPVPRAAVLEGSGAEERIREIFAVGAVATAAEAIGAASAGLDMAVEYAKQREQFGRPIGGFQAVQHLLADAHVQRESAWSTVLFAAGALDEGLDSAHEAASIAKAHASRAARVTIETALQVLGGVAFTWEHDVHLLQRRVLTCERRFGDAAQHERMLGATLARRRLGVA